MTTVVECHCWDSNRILVRSVFPIHHERCMSTNTKTPKLSVTLVFKAIVNSWLFISIIQQSDRSLLLWLCVVKRTNAAKVYQSKCTVVLTHVEPDLTEDHQKADEALVDSEHTITWAPAFVLAVINTPPEFDPHIYWSNQIWHAISKALFAKDILMQIKLKWGNVKYPLFKITHFADLPPPLPCAKHPFLTLMETFIFENKIKGTLIDYAKL